MKFTITTTFMLCVFGMSFAQNDVIDTRLKNDIGAEAQQELYKVDAPVLEDKLLVETLDQNISIESNDFFSEEEWIEVKNKIKKEKSKVSTVDNRVHVSKIIDTVFLYAPDLSEKSHLSSW